jgi:N-acyl homoserine lactone hydrolase
MKIKKYPLKKSSFQSWDELFQNPGPISLESFITGTVIINRRGTLNPEHPLAGDVRDEELEVPILAHLVRHEELGDYLLDAGLDASYHQDPFGGMKGLLADEFHQKKDQNIGFHLEKRDIALKGVFLSHLHPDHMAGVREISHNIPYVVGKGEFEEYPPEIYANFFKGVKTLYEIDFLDLEDMHPLGPVVDLLGDGSLGAIWTPGHTPGHMSFLVNSSEGPIFLTMDASFVYDNLERRVAPSDYTWDVGLAQSTLESIIDFLNKYPQVRVGPGHEVLK